MRKVLGPIFALALLALGGGPLFAAGPASQPAVPAVAAPSVEPGCGPLLDLAAALPTQGEVCAVSAVASPALDDFMSFAVGRRTCRCSCGFPCQTNADCGPGGVCGPGITCC